VAADTSVQDSLGEIVGELLELVDGIVPASARFDLEEGRRRLEEERVNLVVLGEFKRGKSTLVNSLVESNVVPTGVLPLTAAVIAVRHGETPRLVVTFADGGRQEVALEQMAEFATETGNPHNRRGVQLLMAELPARVLAEGLQLIDTPGIGSVHYHNTETALGFLGQVDAAIFTLAADQPLSAAEEGLIGEAAERVPLIFFALNKVDHLTSSERRQTVEFVAERLQTLLGSEPELFPLSARSGEGLEALRRRLERFAARERQDVLARSVRLLAAAFAAEAAQAVRFEAHTVELPLLDLEKKLTEFRARSERLGRANEEGTQLLRQAAGGLIAEKVNEPLLSLAAREGPTLVPALQEFAAEQGKVAPGALAERLEAWIDRTISERFEHLAEEYEQRVAHELGELHERYAKRVDRSLKELDAAAAEVFGERPGRRAPRVSLSRASHFSFKLHDMEREVLDHLASLAAASAPGLLGRRLVLRQAEQRLLLMLDRHAGRLRSDLAQRIETTIREYERELGFVVREAIASVEAAVERATREQRSGRLHVTARLDELQRIECCVHELHRQLADGQNRSPDELEH
jgi:small GTP-binding protein